MSTLLKDKTVYIVSGFMRTGTSMMMRALEAGGMEVVKRDSREEWRKKFADKDYDPNAGGLYELENKDYQQIGFPCMYQGKLLKCLMGGIDSLCVCPQIKMVFMRRDTEEIIQSYEGFFGQKLMIDTKHFQEKTELCIKRMENRKDMQITVLWYRDVINDPLGVFKFLKYKDWPISPQKATRVVKPNLYRFRKERLTIGV